MKKIKDIIEICGGSLGLAYALQVHQITVQRWVQRGRIPKKYYRLIQEKFGITIK